jgi:hypothetical protein
MFHGHLDYFQKPPLGGRPNTKPGDHGTPTAKNHWLILFHHAWGPAWIEIHWNSIWLWARSHMASHYTRGSVTALHDFGECVGTAFGHFLLGSHNLTFTALGSCVKWPQLISILSVLPFPSLMPWGIYKGRFTLAIKAVKSWGQLDQYLSSFETRANPLCTRYMSTRWPPNP